MCEANKRRARNSQIAYKFARWWKNRCNSDWCKQTGQTEQTDERQISIRWLRNEKYKRIHTHVYSTCIYIVFFFFLRVRNAMKNQIFSQRKQRTAISLSRVRRLLLDEEWKRNGNRRGSDDYLKYILYICIYILWMSRCLYIQGKESLMM